MKKWTGIVLITLLLLAAAVIAFVYSGENPLSENNKAGNPEDVAAVILHTNDVHVGVEDNIGYDGLALFFSLMPEMPYRELPWDLFPKDRRSSR